MSMTPRRVVAAMAALVAALAGTGALAHAAEVGSAPCRSGATRQRMSLVLSASDAQPVVSVVASVAYDPTLLRLPETGGGPAVRRRVSPRAAGSMVTPNNSGSDVRIVVAKGGGLTSGPLADIEFDRCAGARAPRPADLTCRVESCAGNGGPIEGCRCAVALPE